MADVTRFSPGMCVRLTPGTTVWHELELIERTAPLVFNDLGRESHVLVLACAEKYDRYGEAYEYAFVLTRKLGAVWVCCFNIRGVP